jgi:hypothetical protein
MLEGFEPVVEVETRKRWLGEAGRDTEAIEAPELTKGCV